MKLALCGGEGEWNIGPRGGRHCWADGVGPPVGLLQGVADEDGFRRVEGGPVEDHEVPHRWPQSRNAMTDPQKEPKLGGNMSKSAAQLIFGLTG